MDIRKGYLAMVIATVILLSGCISPEKEEKPALLGDVTPPHIRLMTPANNSFISRGDTIRLNISDMELDTVFSSVNDSPWAVLPSPYEVDTSSWVEGEYTVKIRATDISNNTATARYHFEIDLTKPEISLVSPPNGSAMESGTHIILNITDKNLMGANYSLDGKRPQCLPPPFKISTLWWSEGEHELRITALDMAMNSETATFTFWIDNKDTRINLIYPLSRIFRAGTEMLFSVEDTTLKNISYSINGADEIPWSAPWTINTDGWPDGTYSITIRAVDEAGHTVLKTYQIEIDSTPPVLDMEGGRNIEVKTRLYVENYTFIKEKQEIKVNISEPHLKEVLCSLNDGEFTPLEFPYTLNPTVWRGQKVNVTLKATDAAGNEAESIFEFNLSFILRIYMRGNYSLGNYSDISIPLLLDDPVTEDVFECINGTANGTYDKIVAYYGGLKTFNVGFPDKFNSLKEISPSMGLSIRIRSDFANFTAGGILPSNWTIQLKEGKNFVSYPSMNPMRVDRALQGIPWYLVQRWDWENQQYVDMKGNDIMLPGYAYWIYVSYDYDWAADF